jgi:O-antigen/teichoic acid export membrane protein
LAQTQIKNLFTDSLVYSAGNIVTRLLPFLLLPVYTHYFSPEQFGVYSLVRSLWFFAAVFYLYGMETAFQKFFIESKDFEERKKIFSSTLILILITSVILSLILFITSRSDAKLLTGNSSDYYLIRILALLLIIDPLSRFPMILLNGLQLSKLYTTINISSVIVNFMLNLFFIVVLKLGIESILYAFIIYYAFLFIMSFWFCRKYFELKIHFDKIRILVRFAFSFLFYGLFLISLDLIDRFFLGHMKGNDEVGIYSACYTIGMAMNLLISGFRTAWMPFFLNLKEEENNKLIFSRVFTFFCYGGMIIFLAISLFANDLVRIRIGNFVFMDERYWSGMVILPYILGAYFLFGLYTNLNIASYFENKIKYLIISSGIAFASNIILNIVLIPPFSIIGAAVATMISYFIMFIVLYYYSQKIYFISYEWNKIISIWIFTLILFFVNLYLPDFWDFKTKGILLIYIAKSASILLLLFVLWRFKTPKAAITNKA